MDARMVKEGDSLAAVDIGSNSFHLVVARYEHGELRVIDRVRESVRMAMGLREDGTLEADRHKKAISCLAKFGQRLRDLPSERVKAVATNTVRRLKNPQAFLLTAETALNHPIEIVSGREEGRLIYLGVAHDLPASDHVRLVIDIGGGSTEFILGHALNMLEAESVQMGCIATTLRFFADGKLSEKRWIRARTEIEAELQQFASNYKQRGWKESIGSSGTAKALSAVSQALGHGEGLITADSLEAIRKKILEADRVETIKLPGLIEERRPLIAGGALIMEAAFAALRIKQMRVSETAMREGLLYDLLGRAEQKDPRKSSILGLAKRYGVDLTHAKQVQQTALALFDQVAEDWQLNDQHRDWLSWCALIHEIGLAIAHSQFHVHGAYLLQHSDLFGFSKQEQQALSFIIRAHRRNFPVEELHALASRFAESVVKIAILLRLATMFHRPRSKEKPAPIKLAASEKTIKVGLPKKWLDAHMLTRADLEQERKYLANTPFKLQIGET